MRHGKHILNWVLILSLISLSFLNELQAEVWNAEDDQLDSEWRHPLIAQTQGGPLGYPRNYANEVTPEEKNDIRFIVLCLANKSLVSIAMAKAELESAGDRIDHLHPFRFLEAILGDPEMHPAAKKIRVKRWVWNHFTGGVKQSLATEASINNLRDEFLADFITRLEVHTHYSPIRAALMQQKWDEFIDLLIKHVPRKGDCDRYDF